MIKIAGFARLTKLLILSTAILSATLIVYAPRAEACHSYRIFSITFHRPQDSMKKQNEIVDQYGLTRFNEKELTLAIEDGRLQRIADATNSYYIDPRLMERSRYALPFTKEFVEIFAEKFHERFPRKRFKLTSFVRSLERQGELEEDGTSDANNSSLDRRSVHPTGAVFDGSRRDLGFLEKQWVCIVVEYWRKQGLVEWIEETKSKAFHIMVSPAYAGNASRLEEWNELAEKLKSPIFFLKKAPTKKPSKNQHKKPRRK